MSRQGSAAKMTAKSSLQYREQEGERERKRKLPEIVAERITEDIIRRGWVLGENLGTERDLIERYAVSRATFREAVRQVERHGAGRMRRGVGGGLIVSAVPRGAVVRALTTYFELTHVSFADQHEVSEVLEVMAARLAAERISPTSAQNLHDLLAQLRALDPDAIEDNVDGNMRIRVAIGEATGNAALPLFIASLNGVLRQIMRALRVNRGAFLRDRQLSSHFKGDLIQAIVARDADAAERLVRTDVKRRLTAMADMMAAPSSSDAIIDYSERLSAYGSDLDGFENPKLAEQVALRIVEDIVRADWKEGHNLGNELNLQARYGVSRAVLREAVRQLELHGIVDMKCGFRGGLVVRSPDPLYTVKLVTTYLVSAKIEMIHLWEVQSALEIHAAESLARVVSAADSAALRKALEALRAVGADKYLEVSAKLHNEIVARTGNRALSLFGHILSEVGLRLLPPVDPDDLPWLVRIHTKLVEAICARDGKASSELMTRLFKQSRRWAVGAGDPRG